MTDESRDAELRPEEIPSPYNTDRVMGWGGTPRCILRADMIEALAEEGAMWMNGLRPFGREDADRYVNPDNHDHQDQFARAVEWLQYAIRTQNVQYKRTSYSWKHQVQRETGAYVSPGCFLLAARHLGYTIVQKDKGRSPNAWLNLSSKNNPKIKWR
jgi:hypothetical protein